MRVCGQDVTASLDETASALAVAEKAETELRSRTSFLESQLAGAHEEMEALKPVKSGYESVQARADAYQREADTSRASLRAAHERVEELQTKVACWTPTARPCVCACLCSCVRACVCV